MASDDNTAATSGGILVVEVFGLDSGVAGDLLQGLAVLVLANAAKVDDRFGVEDVLRDVPLAVATIYISMKLEVEF